MKNVYAANYVVGFLTLGNTFKEVRVPCMADESLPTKVYKIDNPGDISLEAKGHVMDHGEVAVKIHPHDDGTCNYIGVV